MVAASLAVPGRNILLRRLKKNNKTSTSVRLYGLAMTELGEINDLCHGA